MDETIKSEKTEHEKMLAGEPHQPHKDKNLRRLHLRARKLTRRYNNIPPGHRKRRQRLVEKLFGKTGGGFCFLEPPFHCDYGCHITVGKFFFMNFGGVILDTHYVTIGDNVMCGPNVQILCASHPTDPKERIKWYEFSKPVTIGSNVWIGAGAIICPGVTIGDNVTIGAGSIVVKDIPANSIAVGNPCKVIKTV